MNRMRKLGSIPIARYIWGLVLACVAGCPNHPKQPDDTPPTIVQTSQSASSVLAGQVVTFDVTAQDAETLPLQFSWTASTGDLGNPSSTDTSTEASWTAPLCTPQGELVTITVTVTDDGGLSASESFTVSVKACPSLQVAAGRSHSLLLRADGTVWAWGDNSSGKLGDGQAEVFAATPQPVPSLNSISFIATGWEYSLAVRSDGTVWAWGDNSHGQLGDGTRYPRTTPVQVPGLSNVTAVAASDGTSLALRSDGTVWGWGDNAFGQLGREGAPWDQLTPVQMSGLSNATAISAGCNHSVALQGDGTVWAWGSNYYGQLGDGTTIEHFTPAQMHGLSNIIAIAAGCSHTLALRSDGTVWGTGSNSYDQLGSAYTTTTPVQLPYPTYVTSIAVNYSFPPPPPPPTRLSISPYSNPIEPPSYSVATLSDGTLWTWGDNRFGQLGDGTTASRYIPRPVSGLTDVTHIAAGSSHVLALTKDGTLWGWGEAFGRNPSPVPVPGLSSAIGVAGANHSLAVLSDGSVMAWGDNSHGQLGDGTTTQRSTPVQVHSLAGVVAVAAGQYQSLALINDGTLWDLGDGNSTPVQVSGLSNVTAVAAIYDHFMALRDDGTVWTWGDNSHGQLGDGTTTSHHTPAQVPGLANVTAIAAGHSFSVALRSDGTVWAWGYNLYGSVGDGTITDHNTPVQVSGLSGVTALSSGGYHTLALREDGTVWAWGFNNGELGNGTTAHSSTPVQVSNLSSVKAVAAGGDHSMALRNDGSVWTWGYNLSGRLGDGTTINRLTPVQVTGLSNIIAIAGGTRHSMAIRDDHTVWVWGDGSLGQLGDGFTQFHLTPVQTVLP